MAKKPFSVVQGGEPGRVRHRLRVLIADDDRDTTLVLAAILRDEGDEVHVALRGDEVLDVVLVAFTGYGKPEDVAKADQAGFDQHVQKGGDPVQLVEIAARLVRNRG